MKIKTIPLLLLKGLFIIILTSLMGCGATNDNDDSSDSGSNLDFIEDTISNDDWKTIGNYFDNTIYDKVTSKFSTPIDEDNNDQIIILFYTMENDSLGGYFWSGDFFSNEPGSNQMEILYINKTHFNIATDTIAHELEHLVNASERLRIAQKNNGTFEQQSTWIDEGLAEAAAHLVKESVLSDHITNYNNGALKNGTPLIKWTSDFDDYTQSYLFFQYIKNQATNGDAIFKNIIESTHSDYRAVEAVVIPENEAFSTFDEIISGYAIANLARQSNGIYGYKDEMSLFTLNLPKDPINSQALYPGGIIYKYPNESDLTTFLPNGAGSNIHFYRINQNSTENTQLSDIEISEFNQTALVILNKNTDDSGSSEATGTLPNSTYPSSGRIVTQKCKKMVKCASFTAKKLGEMLRLSYPTKEISSPSRLTYETLTHSFNTYDFSSKLNNIKVTASLRYGTATSNCLIYSGD